MNYCIYGLREKGKRKFRYIGMTTNPKARFQAHCCGKSQSRLDQWKRLVIGGRGLVMEIIKITKSCQLAWNLELAHIALRCGEVFNIAGLACPNHPRVLKLRRLGLLEREHIGSGWVYFKVKAK